tara:strand:+ start:401 stop:1063 length:663 start_codon:yes stop_codon:yes gene_type:complete
MIIYLYDIDMSQKIYAVTNEYIRDKETNCKLVKVGKTKNFEERIKQLSNTNVPGNYEPLFVINVSDMDEAENRIHRHLSLYHTRCQGKEFWLIPIDDLKNIFEDYMKWDKISKWYIKEGIKYNEKPIIKSNKKREMKNYFNDGLELRSILKGGGTDPEWYGIYNSSKDKIVCNGNEYRSPSHFYMEHKWTSLNKYYNDNGWRYVEYKNSQGRWIKIDHLT